jgi:hypothetical protein
LLLLAAFLEEQLLRLVIGKDEVIPGANKLRSLPKLGNWVMTVRDLVFAPSLSGISIYYRSSFCINPAYKAMVQLHPETKA